MAVDDWADLIFPVGGSSLRFAYYVTGVPNWKIAVLSGKPSGDQKMHRTIDTEGLQYFLHVFISSSCCLNVFFAVARRKVWTRVVSDAKSDLEPLRIRTTLSTADDGKIYLNSIEV